MLEKIKLALRITGAFFDAEIETLINSCKADLGLVGVTKFDETDSLIYTACLQYVRSYFGDNKDSEKYKKSYDEIRLKLSMRGEYHGDNSEPTNQL